MSPRVVLFDLNGTLTDPAALGQPWDAPELGRSVLKLAVQAAMVCLLLGRYCDFADHLACALRLRVAEGGFDPSRIDDALEIAGALPAYGEAGEALEAARLASRFERILGVDAVGSFKPHPATYQYALAELRCHPADVVFVSAHRYALAGAAHARMRTAFVRRGHGDAVALSELHGGADSPAADIEGPDLAAVASELLAA